MDVASEEQPRVDVKQDRRHDQSRPERAQAAGLGHAVLLRELERSATRTFRVEALQRDQGNDEDRREAPGDLGRRPEPAQPLDALDEADHKRDEQRVAGPAGDPAQLRPGYVEAVAETGFLAAEDLRRGACKGDVEEDSYEEERVKPDRDEREVQEPRPVDGIEPGALEDPEAGDQYEATGRDDGEPEERGVLPDELEARAHKPCAVRKAACHGGSIGFAGRPAQPRK